jgi:hypothetical protein
LASSVGQRPTKAHQCAAAKMLGVTIPITLLGRADEVIE